MIHVRQGDNLEILPRLRAGRYALIYLDPPFNTGRIRERSAMRYADRYDDYLAFLGPRLDLCWRLLTPTGSLLVHLDQREVHYVKVWLDQRVGRDRFRNEIIWAYDYGARAKDRWSPKHDTILWYTRDPRRWTFHREASDRLPYLSGLVSGEKKARGKLPTDTWWHTIVSPTGREKTGYPTQKPLGILERLVKVHSSAGDRLLDPFAGSGSFGEAADRHGREVVLIDQAPAAIRVMRQRFAGRPTRFY